MDYYKKYIKYKNKYFQSKKYGQNNIVNSTNSTNLIKNNNWIICTETWQDYINYVSENNGKNCKWIYEILDGKTNGKEILYQNNNFILIKDIDMSSSLSLNPDKNDSFHLLAFPKNKSLKTMRDLTQNDIPLLEEIIFQTKNYIVSNFSININEIKAHFHYPPSVMILHIHFELINNNKCTQPLKEFPVSNSIENLKIDSDYYKKISLQIIRKKTN